VTAPPRARTFGYGALEVDTDRGVLTCHYRLDDVDFVETATFEGVDLDAPGVRAAAELYHLLAGLSYYKAGAPRTLSLGELPIGDAGRALLLAAVHDGLGEFALRNDLDLRDVELTGGSAIAPAAAAPRTRGPLVPFGGGIDSIVTALAASGDRDATLFVVGPRDDRFAAIERPAAQLGLPVVRCARALDDKVRRSALEGYLDGHVPVTAMVSALALVASVARGHDAVVMSNERSASVPNLVVDGRAVNHQWSKSLAAEELLRAAVDERLSGGPTYASALRDRSELWVASEFARHEAFLDTFMSCNRAFRQDPATRAATWCGECDKCRFTDLVLAPFVARERLEAIFAGREPLADVANVPAYEVLCGIVDNPKPFECVGDVSECATAMVATAARHDRSDQVHLAALAAHCTQARPLAELLAPDGPTHSRLLDAARDLV
jgi:hypothetical protein